MKQLDDLIEELKSKGINSIEVEKEVIYYVGAMAGVYNIADINAILINKKFDNIADVIYHGDYKPNLPYFKFVCGSIKSLTLEQAYNNVVYYLEDKATEEVKAFLIDKLYDIFDN